MIPIIVPMNTNPAPITPTGAVVIALVLVAVMLMLFGMLVADLWSEKVGEKIMKVGMSLLAVELGIGIALLTAMLILSGLK